MKLMIVTGTRPEIIKLSPVIKECLERGLDITLVHSGQHYSYEMDRIFFEELDLPEPDYNLEAGSGTHGCQTASILCGIEKLMIADRPDWVIVQGDTNTVLASALAASKLHIKVAHVEAGCRSYNRMMPEEINRVLTDHVSDLLFVQSDEIRVILLGEGIKDEKIEVVGNTIVDAVIQNLSIANEKSVILQKTGVSPGKYGLLTLHRQENVDDPDRFSRILDGVGRVAERYGISFVYPVHPRSRKMIAEHNIHVPENIIRVDPVGFLDFLSLESSAYLIMTDSGGVQFEACVLRVPCVTLRDETEIPETVIVGSNVVAGTDPVQILRASERMVNVPRDWPNPFGDGDSGKKIIDRIMAGN